MSGACAFQEYPTRSADRRRRRRRCRRRRASADLRQRRLQSPTRVFVVKRDVAVTKRRALADVQKIGVSKHAAARFHTKKRASEIASGGGGHSSRDRECAAASAKRATPNFSLATVEMGARAAAADCWRAGGAKNTCRAARNRERPARIASSISTLAVDFGATSNEPPIGLASLPLTGGYKTRFAFACATRILSAEDRALRS